MAVVVNSDAICSVRNKMLVENGGYRVIGRPVRDGMWVENEYSQHVHPIPLGMEYYSICHVPILQHDVIKSQFSIHNIHFQIIQIK